MREKKKQNKNKSEHAFAFRGKAKIELQKNFTKKTEREKIDQKKLNFSGDKWRREESID